MAEAVGLALGGIALVGLFSTCLEFIDYVADGKAYEEDAPMAATKIGLLRTRLQHWGERHAITCPGKEDDNLRAQWPNESEIIIRSLYGIQSLLTASLQLSGKHANQTKSPKCSSYSVATPPSHGYFQASISIQPVRVPARNVHQQSALGRLKRGLIRVWKATSWALQDKSKLEACIRELDFFITNLEKVSKRLTEPSNLPDPKSGIMSSATAVSEKPRPATQRRSENWNDSQKLPHRAHKQSGLLVPRGQLHNQVVPPGATVVYMEKEYFYYNKGPQDETLHEDDQQHGEFTTKRNEFRNNVQVNVKQASIIGNIDADPDNSNPSIFTNNKQTDVEGPAIIGNSSADGIAALSSLLKVRCGFTPISRYGNPVEWPIARLAIDVGVSRSWLAGFQQC